MAGLVLNEEVAKASARVVLGYFGAFFYTVTLQVMAKDQEVKEYKDTKKKLEAEGKDIKGMFYSRYTNPKLVPLDRSVANFVEWAPMFLMLLLTHTAVAGDCSRLGWAYVGLRFLYPILAKNGGITAGGAQPLIFAATFPMYGVLFALAYGIAQKVMF